jgi:hypothetical protein
MDYSGFVINMLNYFYCDSLCHILRTRGALVTIFGKSEVA